MGFDTTRHEPTIRSYRDLWVGVKQGKDVQPAPELGEHNFEVFRRVGLARDEVMELAEEGVV